MSDYIKRESRTLIEIADDLNDLVTELNDKIVELIREKNVDVAPIRHGHWVEDEIQIHVEKTYHCSECDCLAWGEDEKTRYCPTCGARMNDDDKWEE